MADLTTIPLQDSFETSLTQALTSVGTTMYVNDDGDFTFPSGVTTYATINPGKSNQEVVELSAKSSNTFTIDNRNITQGNGKTTTAQSHAVGSKVIISDNYQFWLDIKDAVNAKLDSTQESANFDQTVTGTNFRIREDGGDMKLTDDNQSEVTLSTLAAGGGADEKVKISSNDTTSDYLDTKLVAGDGITLTENNDGSNETLTIATDGSPPGLITAYGGASAPSGWLLCDGTTGLDSVTDTTLAALFAIIGTTYGGTGAADFDLPDLRGNVPVGKDSGTFSTLGASGGAETHTLTESEMPAHTHTYNQTVGGGSGGNIANGSQSPQSSTTTGSTGGGNAHNNLQPYLVVNYIIKK